MSLTPTVVPKKTDLLVGKNRADALRREALCLPSWDLTPRQVWDLELLLNGAFAPLEGFLNRSDYEGVCTQMRLNNGALWPIPITLDVTESFAEGLARGARVALRHPEGMLLAVLSVGDVWQADRVAEAEAVLGTADEQHPGVFSLLRHTHPVYVGGSLEGLELPPHHTFAPLRHTPAQLREVFKQRGWEHVVAFQTRNPLHRAHVELTRRAMAETGAALLLHPVVGRTSPGDVDYFSRVRCYEAVLEHYPPQSAALSLLPLAMRMAGPREALWHALIRKNYGCTHFIVGRDHAGARRRDGQAFYDPHAARELVEQHEQEMGIKIVGFEEMVYLKESKVYAPRSQASPQATPLSLSGSELRHRLRQGLDVPEWFSFPDVMTQLRRVYPPRSQQGFTVFFTGLSGAGKSTIAQVLVAKLMEQGTRPVTLLDGDIVRKNLSSELGFSKEHRDLNIRRIGFVASLITQNRGVAVCAPIAPYAAIRREVREDIEQHGGFVEVHVATPLEVCESRDRKGLYAKARAGLLKGFTGIDDPYEVPQHPEVVLDTSACSVEHAVDRVLDHLRQESFV